MENLIGQQIEQFRIDALLGEGGMGAVYRATDVNLARVVALKVTHRHLAQQAQFQERFMQEARAAARLQHPNIVPIYHFGRYRELMYMVMEYVSGPSLGGYIRRLQQTGQVVELRESLEVLAQVAEALGYAHRQGIVHRDIKPDNVLLRRLEEAEEEGGVPLRAMVTDFGLAKLLEGGVETKTGTFMGTLPYMSPEQTLGQELDGRSDLYSLGVMLYQMATGQLPFTITSPTDAVLKHMQEVPPPPRSINPGLPAKVDAIIQKALAKQREERFASGTQLARALRASGGELTAADVTAFAAPGTVLSLMTRLEMGGATAPSRLGEELTALPGQMQLLIARSGEAPRGYDMGGGTLTVGRSRDNDVTLDVAGVSREHAKIERTERGWQVTDLNSTNGSYINDNKLLAGVPEPWEAGQRLRIGPYYLTWRQVEAGAAPGPTRVDAPPRSYLATRREAPITPERPPAGASQVYSTTGALSVVLNPAILELQPGERGQVQVELLNHGTTVDHYRLQVDGLPADWYTVPQESVQLMPGGQGTLVFMIHPPRRSDARAGSHTYQLQVQATAQRGEQATTSGQVLLGRYQEFTSDLRPARVADGEQVRVLIYNRGNAPTDYRIVGRDAADRLLFGLDQNRLSVPPGERAAADMQVSAQARPLFGRLEPVPFTVQVLPSGGDGQTHTGTLEVKPRFPAWLPAVLLTLLGFLCLAAVAAGFFLNSRRDAASATATFEVVAAITATAAADPDNDGLPTAQELVLGTDPNNPDTDGDGLKDGDELRLGTDPLNPDSDNDGLSDGLELTYGSNPLAPDSDGDTLLDGAEVEAGTSPILADTDGDGLNDNVDPDPGQLPTLTPTPTLTETPTTQPPTPTTTGTPVPPTATPTPTPTLTPSATPTPPVQEPPRVGLLDNGNVWLLETNFVDPNAPTRVAVNNRRLLLDGNNAQRIRFSPSGRQLAVVRVFFENTELGLLDLSGRYTTLVAPADLYTGEWNPPPDGATRTIDQVAWTPDGQTIVFNTRGNFIVGSEPQGDLWTVTLDGVLREVMLPGQGGPFALSPTGELIMAARDSLLRTDLNGARSETLVRFEPILTYSEYIYYPEVVWQVDGRVAHVAVPSADPLGDNPTIALYEIPAGGPARQLTSLTGSGFTLADQLAWSPDGQQLAYVQRSPRGDNRTTLFIGRGDGSNLGRYGDDGFNLVFLGWSPDNIRFLYTDLGDGNFGSRDYYYTVASTGGRPLVYFPALGAIQAGWWLTAENFLLVVAGRGNNSRLFLGNPAGELSEILSFDTGLGLAVEVWP